MAITTFIPQIWSARLFDKLQKNHVATAFVNTDYEGTITQQGDKVHINSIGDITVDDYTKNNDISAPEALTTVKKTLEITEAKYFNFQVDDVDKVQAANGGELIDKAMGNAAYQLADVADQYIFAKMAAGAADGNKIGETELTAENIYSKIIELRLKLDKANVPTAGRQLAVPPEAYALLLQDSRFVAGGGSQAEEAVRSGLVGRVAGFEVYESNNLPTTEKGEGSSKYTTTKIIASVATATTYAEQIAETEAYRMEKRFADGVKGLHLYGAEVVDPSRIATLEGKF